MNSRHQRNIYQIIHKFFKNKNKKQNPHKEVREERLSQVFRARVCALGRDTGTGMMIACFTLKRSGRTHRDASHARARIIAGGERPHRTAKKTVDNNRQINPLIISVSKKKHLVEGKLARNVAVYTNLVQ